MIRTTILLMFLSANAVPSDSQLWNAVSNGELPLVQELLEQGADPTSRHHGRTYLEIAAQNSLNNRMNDMLGITNPWVPVIEVLIRHGANPKQVNLLGHTPFEHYEQYVLLYPSPGIVKLLA